MSCPICQELQRRGIQDPILALERQMLVNNLWVNRLIKQVGYEQMKAIVEGVEAEADAEIAKGKQ